MRVARAARARGQALAAVTAVVVVGGGLLALDRAGPNPPAAAEGGAAPSGAWMCPHGGGRDWDVSLFLANPGASPVTARVTGLDDRRPGAPTTVGVAPGATVRIPATADVRGSATYVEYFGGWIGAGWVASSGPDPEGLAAEPCSPEASRRWFVPDGTTELDEDAFVIVTNPFGAEAILDVAIFSPDRAPVRDSEWTDLVIRPRRSVALHVDTKVEGETVTAAAIEVSVGRVVAASLGISDETRIRSALGRASPSAGAIFPQVAGSGQAELIVFSLGRDTIRFGATALSDEPPRPAGGLTEEDHAPASARAYAVPVEPGPTAIRLFTLDGAEVVGALRARGPGADLGATAGAGAPASAWLVFPALAGASAEPALVLVNDGDDDVVATLEILGGEGGTAAAPISVQVPAHTAAAVPPEVLASAPGAAVVVRAAGGEIVALAASSAAAGREGVAPFALSMGVPLPQRR